MKTLQLYLSDLKELLQDHDFVSARSCLKEVSPIDLADGWEHFTPEERRAIFRLLSRPRANQLFEELDSSYQQELLEGLQQETVQDLLHELDPSEVGRVARRMPQNVVRHLMSIMRKSGRESVQQFLQFPPQTVGALMRSRFVTISPRLTTKQALERVRLSTRLRHIEQTHLDNLMVVDTEGRLSGVVGLKSLIVAPGDMPVRDLMDTKVQALSPELDQEEAVKLFSKYKFKSLPVVDGRRKLLGVVVFRDLVDVASEETEEDFAKMAGVRGGLATKSVLGITRVRLPWLVATCVGELIVAYIIKHHELTLSKLVALATFIPLIAAMGGSVGSQTATVMVRGLATGEVKPGQQFTTVAKEISAGILLGAFYGLLIGFSAWFLYGDRYGWKFAALVGTGMLVSMSAASSAGAIEPLVFKRLGIDPATATGPLITTFTDLLSTAVYFGLATWFLM